MALRDQALGVASFKNTETLAVRHIGLFGADSGDMANFTHSMSLPGGGWNGKLMPVNVLSHEQSDDQACEPLPNDTPSLKDRVVLARMGGCLSYYRAKNLAAKGASHLIFYSANPDRYGGVWAAANGIRAVTIISAKDGIAWIGSRL